MPSSDFARALARALVLAAGVVAGPALAAPAVPLPPARPAEIARQQLPVADVPLPLPRPATLAAEVQGPPMPPADGPPMPDNYMPPGPAIAADLTCGRVLSEGHVVAKAEPPVVGDEGCGIEAPLRLSAIVRADGTRVRVEPALVMRCDLADQVANWVRDDLAGQPIVALADAGAYVCRSRNHVAGAKISEHARGDAMDVGTFVMASGERFSVVRQDEARPLMAALRATACARFMTVLGPGSDPFHDTHVHLDLEPRARGTRLCQWSQPWDGT